VSVYVREIPEFHLDGLPLGRHVEHDDRSRQYEFAPRAGVTLQAVRHQRFVPLLDQGTLRSCTGNAALGAAGTGAVFQAIPAAAPYRPETADAVKAEDEAVALYSTATRIDGIPGSWTPDDTGSTGLAAAKALKQAGLIAGYLHTFSLQAALAALQAGPLMVGMNWYDSFDTPDPSGLVRITPAAQVRGAHEVVADELLPDQQLVGFPNSWSEAFGLQGRFYLTWDDFGRLLDEQGDVIVPVPLSQPMPQPVQPAAQQVAQPSPPGADQADHDLWAALQQWAHARGLT